MILYLCTYYKCIILLYLTCQIYLVSSNILRAIDERWKVFKWFSIATFLCALYKSFIHNIDYNFFQFIILLSVYNL